MTPHRPRATASWWASRSPWSGLPPPPPSSSTRVIQLGPSGNGLSSIERTGRNPMNAPSLALTGATLITLDPERPSGDTLLIHDDRIAAVGRAADLEQEIAAARQEVDLAGRTVLPGFIDAHVHVIGTGLAHFAVDLTGARTLSQALEKLRGAVERGEPGHWG